MRLVAALALAALSAATAAQVPFSFAVFGDTPYNPLEAAAVPRILQEIDRADMAFVVHVGDLKSATEPCSDRVLRERYDLLEASQRPLVYVPGDNDWTDCHGASAGGYDPRERLERLRALFFGSDESLGRRKLRLARESDDPRFRPYRENVRWVAGNVVFVTLNIPASNNNLGRTDAMDAEHTERMIANFAWLAEALRIAQQPAMLGLVVFAHADPRFERAKDADDSRDGYAGFRYALRTHAAALGKPMLFVHGDGHRYLVDQPLRDLLTHDRIASFTRVEVFGSPFVGWVRIDVTPDGAQLFSISPGSDPVRPSQ